MSFHRTLDDALRAVNEALERVTTFIEQTLETALRGFRETLLNVCRRLFRIVSNLLKLLWTIVVDVGSILLCFVYAWAIGAELSAAGYRWPGLAIELLAGALFMLLAVLLLLGRRATTEEAPSPSPWRTAAFVAFDLVVAAGVWALGENLGYRCVSYPLRLTQTSLDSSVDGLRNLFLELQRQMQGV